MCGNYWFLPLRHWVHGTAGDGQHPDSVISPAHRKLTHRMTSHPQGRLCILPRCLSKLFLPDVKDIAGQCPLLSPMGSDFMLTTFSAVPDERGCFLWESACSHPLCMPSPSVRQECGPHGRRSLSRKAMIATQGVQNTGEDNFTFVQGNFKQQIECHQKGILSFTFVCVCTGEHRCFLPITKREAEYNL